MSVLKKPDLTDPKLRAKLAKGMGQIGRAQSELQSHSDLVCRLLLEKKKIKQEKKNTKKQKKKNTKIKLYKYLTQTADNTQL